MEACLELMKDNSIILHPGLTSSSVEMASKGNLGIELILERALGGKHEPLNDIFRKSGKDAYYS